jgi:hypothetical protein
MVLSNISIFFLLLWTVHSVFAVAAVIVIVWPVVDYNESNNISSMLNTPMFTIFAHLIDVKLH